jgi:hypothetical protein
MTPLKINWSVWDANPVVAWTWNDKDVIVAMRLPPVAVALLPKLKLIAIVGNFDEFGSNNLLLYSFDGVLHRTYGAPSVGKDAQFGGIQEGSQDVDVIVGFRGDTGWQEISGKWNFDDGTLGNTHRSY